MFNFSTMRYGNFCGPGPYDEKGFAKSPINAVDAACKIHDIGYRDCGLVGLPALKAALPGSQNSCVVPSDVTLIKDLDDVIENPNTPTGQRQIARVIRGYFGLKTKMVRPEKKLDFSNWLKDKEEDTQTKRDSQ
jgi:hypothetical protein